MDDNLKPSITESIRFMFDTFISEHKNRYSDFAFCGMRSDDPAICYPIISGDLIRLREAVDSSSGYLRQNCTLNIMSSHDSRFSLPEEGSQQDMELREAINKDSNSSIAKDTFEWLDNSPEIVDHYVFVGICMKKDKRATADIVVVTSNSDDLYSLYCTRRLQEFVYQLITPKLNETLELANTVNNQIADETYDRVVRGILRSLSFFELSRRPLAFVSVISSLVDMIIYHNYPTLTDVDKESIKEISYKYLQHTGLVNEADVKKIITQTKQTPLTTLDDHASNFIKIIKEERDND